MRLEPEVLLNSPPIDAEGNRLLRNLPHLLLAALLVWLFGWYWTTAAGIESMWAQSGTFQHGYMIVPISLWLIWRRRQLLKQLPPTPVFWPLIPLALLGFGWLLGDLAQVVVIRQYALVLMIPVIVTAILGVRLAWAMAFPLAFLVLAVPFGEFLIPPLINFTADFTVSALRLTGIPVFREGTHFSLPTGDWSVVEACSGLRYLIASLTLGCLYAYLTYRRLRYRLIFIALSLLMPILANGLRAYLIVILGHMSNMQLAVGVDHLIYGWLFFGLVIMLLFWAGSFWREDTELSSPRDSRQMAAPNPLPAGKLLCVALAGVAVTALWPAYAAHVEPRFDAPIVHIKAPEVADWKKTSRPITKWRPRYPSARAWIDEVFEKDGRQVGLLIGYYNNQNEGVKLISSTNALTVTTDQSWSTLSTRDLSLPGQDRNVTAHLSKLRGPGARLSVLHWFWVKGTHTGNSYITKMLQARSRLLGRGDDSAVIMLYTLNENQNGSDEATLREFFRDALPAIDQSLNDARNE